MAKDYKEKEKAMYREKTLMLLEELPDFCSKYYKERELRLAERSQYNYAFKMKHFLEYLVINHSNFIGKSIKTITINDIATLKQEDFSDFTSWLLRQPSYKNSSKIQYNSKTTADNYLASLSSYMSFFVKKELISKNPLIGIDREKKKRKPIIHLQEDDRNDFMDAVSSGTGLTKKQLDSWKNNNLRDTCMMVILLDTGIRVSELVGLNVEDVDLKHYKLNVQRKGDKNDNVYFSDTTADWLIEYLEQRKPMYHPVDNEHALFLVGIGKYKGERISIRAVERMVKKFAKAACIPNWEQITPHKLRSTYAMSMLAAIGNPAIVQEQLGHENPGTTALYARGTEKDKEANRNQIF